MQKSVTAAIRAWHCSSQENWRIFRRTEPPALGLCLLSTNCCFPDRMCANCEAQNGHEEIWEETKVGEAENEVYARGMSESLYITSTFRITVFQSLHFANARCKCLAFWYPTPHALNTTIRSSTENCSKVGAKWCNLGRTVRRKVGRKVSENDLSAMLVWGSLLCTQSLGQRDLQTSYSSYRS